MISSWGSWKIWGLYISTMKEVEATLLNDFQKIRKSDKEEGTTDGMDRSPSNASTVFYCYRSTPTLTDQFGFDGFNFSLGLINRNILIVQAMVRAIQWSWKPLFCSPPKLFVLSSFTVVRNAFFFLLSFDGNLWFISFCCPVFWSLCRLFFWLVTSFFVGYQLFHVTGSAL